MRVSLSWLAVRGIPAEAVFERTRVRPKGEKGEFYEQEISFASLGDQWSVVVAKGCGHRIIDPGALNALSLGCEVVACTVEEHVMVCSSELWSNGMRHWRVEHDAQESIDHLSVEGTPPIGYAEIRDEFAAQQAEEGGADAGVDYYFEVPLVLAKSLVGFKHDERNQITEQESEGLEDLTASNSTKKNWWQLWK